MVRIRSASLPKGTYVKLQPHTTDFINISNPKARSLPLGCGSQLANRACDRGTADTHTAVHHAIPTAALRLGPGKGRIQYPNGRKIGCRVSPHPTCRGWQVSAAPTPSCTGAP